MKKPAGSDPAGEQPQPTQEGAMATNLSIPDREARAATIRGLRDLALYLEQHPDVPIPRHGIEIKVPLGNDDRAAVVAAAEALEVGTEESNGDISVARKFGGGVSMYVYSLSSERMAQWRALQSYTGNVVPESVSA